MTFIGFSTTIQSEKGDVTCPEFWEKEYTQKYARLWQTIQQETPGEKAILENGIGMFALCDDKHSSFEYCAGLYKGESAKRLNLYAFPENDWAILSGSSGTPTRASCIWGPEVYAAGNMQAAILYKLSIWIPLPKPRQSTENSTEIASAATLPGIL